MKEIISQNLREHIQTINGLAENVEDIERAARLVIETIIKLRILSPKIYTKP